MTLGCVGDNATVKGHFFFCVFAPGEGAFLLQRKSPPGLADFLMNQAQ